MQQIRKNDSAQSIVADSFIQANSSICIYNLNKQAKLHVQLKKQSSLSEDLDESMMLVVYFLCYNSFLWTFID